MNTAPAPASPPPCSPCCPPAGTTMSPVPTTWPMSVSDQPHNPHPHVSSHLKPCRLISHSPNPSLTFCLLPASSHFSPLSPAPALLWACFHNRERREEGRERGRARVRLRPREWTDSMPSALLCLRPVLGLMSGACLKKEKALLQTAGYLILCAAT